jgi:hypothetical protein
MARNLFLLVLSIFLCICCGPSGEKVSIKKTEEPEIKYISPERPPRIELRFYKGQYSWTIKSDDPEKIIQADRALRDYTSKLSKNR